MHIPSIHIQSIYEYIFLGFLLACTIVGLYTFIKNTFERISTLLTQKNRKSKPKKKQAPGYNISFTRSLWIDYERINNTDANLELKEYKGARKPFIPKKNNDFEVVFEDMSVRDYESIGMFKFTEIINPNLNIKTYLFLIPSTWFDYIPEGMKIKTIMGHDMNFSKKMARDNRKGLLPFGFIINKKETA